MSSNASGGCEAGSGPDLFFRVPLPPFFDQPYGTDCYFHETGYNVFGGIVLALLVVAIALHLVALGERNNLLIRVVLMLQTAMLVSSATAVILGWILPRYFSIGWAIFIGILGFTGFSWMILGYQSLVLTIQKVETNRRTSLVELIGGPISALILLTLALAAVLASGVGAGGVVAAIVADPPDNERMTPYYRVFCVGTGTFVLVFVICSFRILTHFTNMIERAIQNVAGLVEAGGTSANGDVPSPSSGGSRANQKVEDMKDIVKRFRHLRTVIVLSAPLGVAGWIVQAAVLPMFWYIALLHVMNAYGACIGVLNSVISAERKRNIQRRIKKMTGIGAVVSSLTGGPGSAQVQQSTNENRIGSSNKATAVAAFADAHTKQVTSVVVSTSH